MPRWVVLGVVALLCACTSEATTPVAHQQTPEISLTILGTWVAAKRAARRNIVTVRFQPGPGVQEEPEILAAAEARCHGPR